MYAKPKKRDIAIIIILLLLATGMFAAHRAVTLSSGRVVCVLTVNGHTAGSYGLDKNAVFSPPSLPNITLEIKEGQAAFISSDCPDKICVHTGFIGEPGQMAACLPNKVMIRITREGAQDYEEPDVVS